MELEFHQLKLKYSSLRVVDRPRLARLVASLAEIGQQSPVLTVEVEGAHVLVDGYRRVAALQQLGRDTVRAMALEMAEAEALVFRYRLAGAPGRSPIEDGWLLRELHETHGLSQQDLAERFVRSPSWVSRRLALVQQLPESVQEQVRRGALCAHAAMKYLVPVARANWSQAEKLGEALAGERLSTRQVGEIYMAWRGAAPEQRERIVDQPLLFVKAKEALGGDPPGPQDELEREIQRDIERLGSLARRGHRNLSDCTRRFGGLRHADIVAVAWNDAERAFVAFKDLLIHGLGGA